MSKAKVLYRLEQVLILVAHLALLKWILYVLYEGGTMSPTEILIHFVGMGAFGAALIRGTAYLGLRRHQKELNQQ